MYNELHSILACPGCRGDLNDCGEDIQGSSSRNGARGGAGELWCASCGRRFEIRSGIPIIYPKDFDQAHVEEERKVGELMKRPGPGGAEFFSENQ
jgi:uncharacterized protein YbaR (Trm112 family)